MEETQQRKSGESILGYEIRHSLLWFGVPALCWDVYDWWRHRGAHATLNLEFELGALLITLIRDLVVAIFVGLVFFGMFKAFRRRHQEKEGQIRPNDGSGS